MRKTWAASMTMLLGSAFMAGAPLEAQQDMQHCMAMFGGPPPHMLLAHGEALELNADQVSRLEALQARVAEMAEPAMQRAMESHMAAAALLEGDAPDFQGFEARLREAAEHVVEGHVAMARVAVEARQVLTPEQRTRLEGLMDEMRGPGHHRMPGERRPGMREGAMPGMMGCMMLGW